MKLDGLQKVRAQFGESLKERSSQLAALTQAAPEDRVAIIHRNEEILDAFHTIIGGAAQLGFKHLVKTMTTLERRVRIYLQNRTHDIAGYDPVLSEFGETACTAITKFLQTDEYARNTYGLDKPGADVEAKVNKVRIMIIDDDSTMRLLIRSVLIHAGYDDVISVSSAREARDLAYAQSPDIAICDWRMPDMNGFKLMQSIKSKTSDCMPDARFIMLTMVADDKSVKAAIKNGCFDFITKPFTPNRLLNALKNAIRDINGFNRPAPTPEPSAPEPEIIDALEIG